jgi:mono/diheme cytochrome c family protein
MEGLIKKCRGVLVVFCLILFSLVLVFTLQETKDVHGMNDKTDVGKKVYEIRCLICHGPKGDGKGLVGAIRRIEENGQVMEIHPRDFSGGVFKFRTTLTGCLPTDKDLMNTIENGIKRSFMPSHKHIPLEEREAVKEHIKTFSVRWKEKEYEEEYCDESIKVKKPEWVGTLASVEKGKKEYERMKCWECHGHEGRGDGPKSQKLKDEKGYKILPFNFTTTQLKRGSSPENIYLTFSTGLDGSPMPSYEESLPEDEDRWHLVSYTLELMKLQEQVN